VSPIQNPLTLRFIEEAGNATQALGVGRVLGQIYAYLYFSAEPRTLDDMKEALGISKGSASMGVRQLEQWGAAQRVWVRGDRKDYYTANDYFGRILRSALADALGKRIESLSRLLDEAEQTLNGKSRPKVNGNGEDAFVRQRVQRLRAFQKKANDLWNNPIVRMLLK
jgi:DNA-binding transcriptional regulator GbsR (MarR family)